MLAVFLECRRAHTVQLAPRQRWLQQVRRIHGALCLARADQRVHLIDEQDHLAFRLRDFLQHGFQPLLELATELRAGNQRAHVERHQALLFQAVGHIAIDDAQRKSFRNRGLAHARLADQHRIVLRPARQHLDAPPDFLIAPDHRIKLARARRLGEIARILLQRLVLFLGRRGVRRAPLAQLGDGLDQRAGRRPGGVQRVGRLVLHLGRRQQQPLHGDIVVARRLRVFLRHLEQPREILAQARLRAARALRMRGQQLVDIGMRQLGIAPGGANEIQRKAVAVREHRLDQVFRQDLRMTARKRARLGALNGGACALGIAFEVHELTLVKSSRQARRRTRNRHPARSCARQSAERLIHRKR